MSMLLMVKAMQCKIGNPARKLVLLKLADNANDNGVCFPSYQYIADQCEMSRRSAITHIEGLIESGFVSKQERKNKDGSSSNLYRLHLDKPSENSALGGVKNLHHPSENSALGGGENISPITSHSLEPVNEPKKTTQKKTALLDFEPHFEKFWSAGMRKIGKPQALKKFKSAYEAYNAEYPISLEAFTQMLVDDVAKRLRLKQFGFDNLHPSTYLNNRRWLDDYPQEPAGQNIAKMPSNDPFADNGTWGEGRKLNVDPSLIPEFLR